MNKIVPFQDDRCIRQVNLRNLEKFCEIFNILIRSANDRVQDIENLFETMLIHVCQALVSKDIAGFNSINVQYRTENSMTDILMWLVTYVYTLQCINHSNVMAKWFAFPPRVQQFTGLDVLVINSSTQIDFIAIQHNLKNVFKNIWSHPKQRRSILNHFGVIRQEAVSQRYLFRWPLGLRGGAGRASMSSATALQTISSSETASLPPSRNVQVQQNYDLSDILALIIVITDKLDEMAAKISERLAEIESQLAMQDKRERKTEKCAAILVVFLVILILMKAYSFADRLYPDPAT